MVQRIDLTANNKPVTSQQIHAAAERWARHQRRQGRSHGLRWSRERFVQVTTAWLKFMGRLEIAEPKQVPGEQWIKPFAAYSLDERGLSNPTSGSIPITWANSSSGLRHKIVRWVGADSRTWMRLSLKQKGWCRVSIARSVGTLRIFFRYAEHRGWCTAGIAAGIERPRLYRDEGLPVGP